MKKWRNGRERRGNDWGSVRTDRKKRQKEQRQRFRCHMGFRSRWHFSVNNKQPESCRFIACCRGHTRNSRYAGSDSRGRRKYSVVGWNWPPVRQKKGSATSVCRRPSRRRASRCALTAFDASENEFSCTFTLMNPEGPAITWLRKETEKRTRLCVAWWKFLLYFFFLWWLLNVLQTRDNEVKPKRGAVYILKIVKLAICIFTFIISGNCKWWFVYLSYVV